MPHDYPLFLHSYLKKVVKERDALKQQLQAAKQQISTLKGDYKTLLAGQLLYYLKNDC